MTAREFNMLAMALYGPDYVRPIMRLLKVDRRTIQRYKAGVKPVHPNDAETLRAIVSSYKATNSPNEAQK